MLIGKVGFTGTREGATPRQLEIVRILLGDYRSKGAVTFHHGNCVGADEQAVKIASELGYFTVAHPSNFWDMQAKFRSNVIMPPHPPLIRDHHIVDAVDVMIATPKEQEEILRSGTWATVRYARKVNRPVEVVLP